MMVGIPTFAHPVILEFWRHGPTNSAQDAACDVERTHSANTKARFQAWLAGQEPRSRGVHLFIHSPTRRTKELVEMLSSADAVHHHKTAAVLCEERLYYPQDSLGLQLMTTDRLLADENMRSRGCLLMNRRVRPLTVWSPRAQSTRPSMP